MGKVKNLIWDEIEFDQEEPIQPIPSLEDKEAVQVVPSEEQIRAAHLEKLDAWLAYVMAETPDQEDRWADYLGAIEHHANLTFQRDQANLSEAVICLL